MRRSLWLPCLGAALLLGAAAVPPAGARPSAAQRTVQKKRKSPSSKKKRKARAKKHGQNAPSPDRISEIQSALQRQGVLNEEPTGKWDDATVEAMKKYQADHGIDPSGKIDALTLEKLGLGPDTAGKGAPRPPPSSADPSGKLSP